MKKILSACRGSEKITRVLLGMIPAVLVSYTLLWGFVRAFAGESLAARVYVESIRVPYFENMAAGAALLFAGAVLIEISVKKDIT